MKPRALTPSVLAVGAVDWDNRLFDSLIPLPDGTSYNSYLVRGSEATVLVDAVEPGMKDVLLGKLAEVPRLDHVVSLHAEQDHSGSLPDVLARYPGADLLCSVKAKDMLVDLLRISPERIRTVGDGEELSLGDRTMRFVATPWAHWPETMSAFLVEEGVLFSCDLFGSHLATGSLFAEEAEGVREAAKRYYAEIMMPFAKPLRRSLAKVRDLAPRIIAPSHGPVFGDPEWILSAYEDWISSPPRNRAVVAYVSMHGSTRLLVDRLVDGLAARGVGVHRFDLTATDLGKLAMALVDAGTLVFGTPTVLGGPHPHAMQAAYLANLLKPKAEHLAVVGSYGWKGRAAEKIGEALGGLHLTVLDPVLCRGLPAEEDLAAVDRLAARIDALHREKGFG